MERRKRKPPGKKAVESHLVKGSVESHQGSRQEKPPGKKARKSPGKKAGKATREEDKEGHLGRRQGKPPVEEGRGRHLG